MTRFKVQCPSCAALGTIRDEGLLGRKIGCPRCKQRFFAEQPLEPKESAVPARGKPDRKIRPDARVSPGQTKAPVKARLGPRQKSAARDSEGAKPGKSKKSRLMLGIRGAVGLAAVSMLGLVLFFLLGSPGKANNITTPALAAANLDWPPNVVSEITPPSEDRPKDEPAVPIAPAVTNPTPEPPKAEEPRPEPPKVEKPKPMQPAAPVQPTPPAMAEAPAKKEAANIQANAGGQAIFVPQIQGLGTSVNLTAQAVISDDRRFVRLSLNPSFTLTVPGPPRIVPTLVSVFPRPGKPGQGPSPIVFYNVVQQPAFIGSNVGTTVGAPTGGLGGLGGLNGQAFQFPRRQR
jgi:hypothetical protein